MKIFFSPQIDNFYAIQSKCFIFHGILFFIRRNKYAITAQILFLKRGLVPPAIKTCYKTIIIKTMKLVQKWIFRSKKQNKIL